MKLRFTKMHGAGNDFIVLDATTGPLKLSSAQYRFLADRRFGIGADQILIVEPGDTAQGIDFTYRIMNADGGEVEQCGNGARCFARFVHDTGLTAKTAIRVRTLKSVIEPRLQADGRVTVDMGAPVLDPGEVPFQAEGLTPRWLNGCELWSIQLANHPVDVAVVSMGNPHAVMRVDSVEHAPVAELGPQIEGHARFPRRVNAGFMEVVDRGHIRLRVFERGSGETLACGSGACAAVVAGIRLGWLDERVDVDMPGGRLTIQWGGPGQPVLMTGPAVKVFEGEIDVPQLRDRARPPLNPAHQQGPNMTLQGITEEEIANYLVHTPGFFERNAQLLASIQLTSPHGQRAVSLQERQMEMLRDKIKGLERRIMEMIRNGQENEAIAERLHRWVRAVLLAHDDTTLADVMLERLRHEFLIPQAAVRIWGTAQQPLRAGLVDSMAEAAVLQDVSDDAKTFTASLGLPYCGLNAGFEASRWLEEPASITSLALVPLHHQGEAFGLLVLGSPDPTRYTSDMGVDFLQQVGDITGAALARLLDCVGAI